MSDLKRQVEAIFIRVTEAYEVLRDPGRRVRHERMLGISPASAPPARAATRPHGRGRDADDIGARRPRSRGRRDAGRVGHAKEARALLGQDRNWDAIQKMEGAIALAPATRAHYSLRILLAYAIGRNPKWQKRAEEMLLAVIQENPKLADAHLELGSSTSAPA